MSERKVFVVEDHEFFRRELVRLLNLFENVKVCGACGSAEEALEKLPEAQPDLALLDLSLPKMNGFDLAVEIKKRHPGTLCVILSGHHIEATVDRARDLGLEGYVIKGDTDALERALLDVLAGKPSFPALHRSSHAAST